MRTLWRPVSEGQCFLPIAEWFEAFGVAVRRKLIREVASRPVAPG